MPSANTCEVCGEYKSEHVSKVVPGLVIRVCVNRDCKASSHYIGVRDPVRQDEKQAEAKPTIFDKTQSSIRSVTIRDNPETSIRLEKNFPLAELPTLNSEQLLASLQAAQLFIQENSIAGCSDAELAYWLKVTDEQRKLVLDLVERRKLKITKERQAQFVEQRGHNRSVSSIKAAKKQKKSVDKIVASKLTPEHQKLIKQALMFDVENPTQYATIEELRKAMAVAMAK